MNEFLIFARGYIYWFYFFWERKGVREEHWWERNMDRLPAILALTRGPNLQPESESWLEIEPTASQSVGWHSSPPTTPARVHLWICLAYVFKNIAKILLPYKKQCLHRLLYAVSVPGSRETDTFIDGYMVFLYKANIRRNQRGKTIVTFLAEVLESWFLCLFWMSYFSPIIRPFWK